MTDLSIPDTPKMIGETLSVAETAIANTFPPEYAARHLELLGRLAAECARHRPVGPNGKHGDLHTPTCGCAPEATEGIEYFVEVAPIMKLDQTCFTSPSQWEATTRWGEYLNIRFRWGTLTVQLEGECVLEKQYGNDLDGHLTEEEMLRLTGLTLSHDVVRSESWRR